MAALVPIGMELEQPRREVEQAIEILCGQLDTRIHHRHLSGGRAGLMRVPPDRHAHARILGEQRMEQGGAGAREADHEDRAIDLLLRNAGQTHAVSGKSQSHREQLAQLQLHLVLAIMGERRLLVEPVDELLDAAVQARIERPELTADIARAANQLVQRNRGCRVRGAPRYDER